MPDAVVDIGNSRIKLCRCDSSGLILPVRGFSADDLVGCERLAEEWGFTAGRSWAIATTHPARAEQFADWAASRGETVAFIDSPEAIPIAIAVDFPDRVGVDRLLNALAARAHVRPGQPAIVVSAGTAVTVDLLDNDGAFAGGTIFPGLRLMALALHEHTAKLPLVEAIDPLPDGPPGKNTEAAIRLGIIHAVAGGIDAIVRETAARCAVAPRLFLTGGDMTPHLAGLLQTRHQFQSDLRTTLTLEGLHRAAESLS